MMKTVYTQCKTCSYEYVVDLLVKYFREYHGLELLKTYFRPANFYVGDCNTLFSLVGSGVVWCDTPSDITATPSPELKVIVPSTWIRKQLESRGVKVERVVPRGVNDELALSHLNHDYDARAGYIVIAKNRPYKNVDFVLNAFSRRRKQLVLVSDHPNADFGWFNFPDSVKYYLLSRARFYLAVSDAEGFGIPVVEANAVGTPAIYVKKHAYAQHACGIPVSSKEEALQVSVTREEWEDLSWKCWYHSLVYHHASITQMLYDYVK